MKRFSIVWAFIAGSAIASCVACLAFKQDAAEASFATQQLACVDLNHGQKAIDDCRAKNAASWGRYPDGGKIEDVSAPAVDAGALDGKGDTE